MLSFLPPLIIILFAVSIFGWPSLWNVVIVLGWGSLRWPASRSVSRPAGPRVRDRGARDGGERHPRRPAVRSAKRSGPVLVAATFGVANAILIEAALSFLGLGVQPPTPSWGNMLTDAQSLTVLERMPWLRGRLALAGYTCMPDNIARYTAKKRKSTRGSIGNGNKCHLLSSPSVNPRRAVSC